MPRVASKGDRREEVLNAATMLFVANGYAATTMDDIAHAVSLNKGTLYYYYNNKASILFDIIHQIEEGRLQLARMRPTDLDPREALTLFIEETAIYILANPIRSRISMQESPFLELWLTKEQLDALRQCHEEFQAHLLKPIAKGIKMGVFANLDPRVMTESINGTLAWLPRWFSPKGRLSTEEIARQISKLVINGLEARPKSAAETRRQGTSVREKGQKEVVRATRKKEVTQEQPVLAPKPKRTGQAGDRAKRRRNRAIALNDETY